MNVVNDNGRFTILQQAKHAIAIIFKCKNVVQGRSDGGGGVCWYLYPKSALVNFLWGKNDVRTAIQPVYTPKTFIHPQNKFLATPLNCGINV